MGALIINGLTKTYKGQCGINPYKDYIILTSNSYMFHQMLLIGYASIKQIRKYTHDPV